MTRGIWLLNDVVHERLTESTIRLKPPALNKLFVRLQNGSSAQAGGNLLNLVRASPSLLVVIGS